MVRFQQTLTLAVIAVAVAAQRASELTWPHASHADDIEDILGPGPAHLPPILNDLQPHGGPAGTCCCRANLHHSILWTAGMTCTARKIFFCSGRWWYNRDHIWRDRLAQLYELQLQIWQPRRSSVNRSRCGWRCALCRSSDACVGAQHCARRSRIRWSIHAR